MEPGLHTARPIRGDQGGDLERAPDGAAGFKPFALLHADLDTTWHHLLHPGLFSPLGESSVLRSLQSLPAVSFSTAFTSGLNVRGSRSDGFQVLLDGAPISTPSR